MRTYTAQFARFIALAVLLAVSRPLGAQAFDVRTFSPWPGYAIPNGVWLTGNFDADQRTDVFHAVASGDYSHLWTSLGNGNFTVTTFRPWPGYAIPNGVWLTGDFAGDTKTDVLHAVASGDYTHVWTSTGGGNFTVSTFRPWPGYAIPNGIWLVGDFDGNQKSDVFHAVASGDYAHIWLSDGAGSFNVLTFRPWPGYAIPNGIWRTGDFDNDGRTDILHAVASGDYAHTWLSTGPGTFNVTTFSPWPGYAIPNGEWLIGDFDGDRRSDVFHAVASGDYAHVWTSTSGGNFTVGTFRPWAGYAIPNGVWMAGDVDKDNRTDIIHAVANTDYANVWRSTGAASFLVQSFSPWGGYAIPNGLWMTGDLNADGKTDVFHAVQSGDYAHPWLSVFPGPVEVAVDGIEVTQAIQDMAHTVTLIGKKATWVRVYLTANDPAARTVRGTLQARNVTTGATTTIASNGTATIDPAQAGQLRPKRESMTASLNFIVPLAFTRAGDKQFTLTGVADATTGTTGTCSNCATMARTVTFADSLLMRVRIVGISYTTGAAPNVVTHTPAALDFTLTQSWLGRAFPTGDLVASQTTIASSDAFPFDCGQANAQLATLRNNDINNGTSNLTKYAGLVAASGGYMRGCAGVPGNVASSPTGPTASGLRPVNVTGDTDGSWGDWYTGHELGHSFGRNHPGFCNSQDMADASFPNPNGQISDNVGTFTGLDVGDAGNSVAATVLPGATRFDIMTYCNQPQWVSAYEYEAIRARQMLENPAGTGAPVAGARQRILARARPAADCPCDRPIRPSRAGPPAMKVARRTPPDVKLARREAPALPPVMQDQPQRPTRHFAERFDSLAVVPSQRFPAQVHRGFVPRATLLPPQDPQPPPVQVRIGDWVNVVATVNVTRNSGQIRYINRVRRAEIPVAINDRRASIRVRDPAGRVLLDQPVELRHLSDRLAGEDQLALVDAMIPYIRATAVIELVLSGDVVATKRVSRRPPVVRGIRTAATEIRRANAESEAGVILRWEASDPDGDTLTYTVETASGPNAAWETVAIGLPRPELTMSRSQFGNRRQLRVRISANDGFNVSVPVTTTVSRP